MRDGWRQRVSQLKGETYALYLAYRDPLTPWYARLWVVLVVAYAVSPIDLIPDFIPVLGYLDDLVLIPAGIAVAIRLIPKPVLAKARAQAQAEIDGEIPGGWAAAAVIVVIWVLALGLAAYLLLLLFT